MKQSKKKAVAKKKKGQDEESAAEPVQVPTLPSGNIQQANSGGPVGFLPITDILKSQISIGVESSLPYRNVGGMKTAANQVSLMNTQFRPQSGIPDARLFDVRSPV